jgi:predicted MPP superfamily phosphohydrolase
VILGIHTLLSTAMFSALSRVLGGAWPVLVYLQAAGYLHFLSLVRARPRPLWWRFAVSLPGMFFTAGTFLALPWAVVGATGFRLPGPALPYAVAAFGVCQSLWTRAEEVDLVLDGQATDEKVVQPHRSAPGPLSPRPLRIVQITDPHLGPFMSERRLRRICERAVEKAPDLVLLTGDFLTMESQASPDPLYRALLPLSALPGRCFACRGNHDLEVPGLVAEALSRAGVRLLVDDEALVSTPAGPVQILGADFVWRERAEHLARLCARYPRRKDHLRVVLLHDPGAFRHLPSGEGDLVLSGHTHGGQVGLLSLGLRWTVVRGLSKIPDHGLWARGRDRLYVHRGTGHYGFPLRVGVPAEQSVLRVHRTDQQRRAG